MTRSGEAALDAWTWLHAASGASLALAGLGAASAVGLLAAWEGLEAALRRIGTGRGLFEHESRRNIIADVLVGALAFMVVKAVTPAPMVRVVRR